MPPINFDILLFVIHSVKNRSELSKRNLRRARPYDLTVHSTFKIFRSGSELQSSLLYIESRVFPRGNKTCVCLLDRRLGQPALKYYSEGKIGVYGIKRGSMLKEWPFWIKYLILNFSVLPTILLNEGFKKYTIYWNTPTAVPKVWKKIFCVQTKISLNPECIRNRFWRFVSRYSKIYFTFFSFFLPNVLSH